MKALNVLLSEIRLKQERVSQGTSDPIEEAYQMTLYLTGILQEVREKILKSGFSDAAQEMQFFRHIKPQILGQLMYYNKVFRIEAACPVQDGRLYQQFFIGQLQELKQEFREYACSSEFYRYYRSGRSDRDAEYFLRGRINVSEGLSNYVFEVDPQFSTYYDSRVARIISNDLVYGYLTLKISPDEASGVLGKGDSSKEICWTDSKNALIELIYALHASGVISHGKVGITRVSKVFQLLFHIPLGDIHHSFHRMKDRAGARTLFIDQLKLSLEQYMDKGL